MVPRRPRPSTSAALALLAATTWWCSPPPAPPADADADLDRDAAFDAAVDADADADAEGPAQCLANGDLVLDRAEAAPWLGSFVSFRVNASGTTPAVDVAGDLVDAVRVWRFDREEPGDRVVADEVVDPVSRWFGAEVPDATYAQVVPGFETAAGLYRVDDAGIALVGLASLADESTLVRYDPPPYVVRFPLADGDAWTDETRATGRIGHVAFNADETYAVAVDGAGEVVVPAGVFPALRVRTTLDRRAGPLSERHVAYAWVAECWGRVAYAASPSGTVDPDFTAAAEWWRLALRAGP